MKLFLEKLDLETGALRPESLVLAVSASVCRSRASLGERQGEVRSAALNIRHKRFDKVPIMLCFGDYWRSLHRIIGEVVQESDLA